MTPAPAPAPAPAAEGFRSPAFIGPMVGVIVGALLTVGTQFAIEKPKIKIEQQKLENENLKTALEVKKATLEAQKQIMPLAPKASASCSGVNIDAWTWRVDCHVKNDGSFQVDTSITNARIRVASDTTERAFQSGEGFVIDYPDNKKTFRSQPQSTGDLWFYVKFDRAKYSSGFTNDQLVAIINFDYATIPEITNFHKSLFPDLSEQINAIKNNSTALHVALPVPTAAPLPDAPTATTQIGKGVAVQKAHVGLGN